ncbi:trypsin 3A1-like [Contarinia nasturtii]|uniref:trypsin 3A1-like n=1 Tax=Contarinia nasturtii TaxID=265458 RepID=UPI0012D3D698|nr:trypsin 3A1-like [Contarinia nasturtii]
MEIKKMNSFLHALLMALAFGEFSGHMKNSRAQIIGGVQAEATDFPYHALVMRVERIEGTPNFHLCSGTIYSKFKIITAAHCVNYEDKMLIRVGSKNISSGGETREILPQNRVIHFKYNESTMKYDIAVLLVSEALPIGTATIDKIDLVEKNYEYVDNTMLTVAGFGGTEYTEDIEKIKYSDTLQYLDVPVANFKKCQTRYAVKRRSQFRVTDKHFCAGYYDNKRCFFYGDSGGPIVDRARNKQVGIVSSSLPNLPGVFVKLSDPEFQDWIEKLNFKTAKKLFKEIQIASSSTQKPRWK